MSVRTTIGACMLFLLAACGENPGPLAGTWQASGMIPHQTTFRSGEMESMGMIEKVSYKQEGNSVLVTMNDGLMKGTTVRYVLVDENTAQAMGVTYHKIR